MPLPPIAPVHQITVPDIQATITQPSGTGEFRDLLANSIASVEQQQNNANIAVNNFLTGDSDDLHTAALAGQRAELSLQLFMQVRNKVVNAYQEVMRMQM